MLFGHTLLSVGAPVVAWIDRTQETVTIRAVLVSMASAALLAGCAGTSSHGPLAFATDESRVCGPLPDFRDAALGINVPDDLPTGIVIDSVELLNAKGIAAQGSYLMPMPGQRLLLDKFPPEEQFPDEWLHAVGAVGATVDPSRREDLVVHVVANKNGGTIDGVTITYSVAGRQYTADSLLGLTLTTDVCG